ncbi:MAG: hypothetical protein ACRD3J_20090 [Thermoanaerobaculia bacterium]
MSRSLAFALVDSGVIWALAVAWPRTRNRRFMVVLTILTGILIVVALASDLAGVLVPLVAAVMAVLLIWPEWLGLGSLDSIDRFADMSLRRLSTLLDGPDPASTTLAFLTTLHAPPFTSAGSPWRDVGRFYRVILARVTDPDGGDAPGRTPIGAFRKAGRHFWGLALDRRVIGRRHSPSAWDEDVLLRCYLDEFDRLIPPGSSLDEGFDGWEGWSVEAEQRIDDVSSIVLRHDMPEANRRLVLDLMESRLGVARGDRTPSAVQRMQVASRSLYSRWQAPEDDAVVRNNA